MPSSPSPCLLLRLTSPWALALAVVTGGTTASAHGLEANRMQLVVHESLAEVVSTPPVESVPAADTNHDGLLTVAEVQSHRDEIIRALVAAVVITDADGRLGLVDRADVSVPIGDDEARGSDFLRLTVVLRWPSPPGALRVRCGFVTQHPVTLFATRADSHSHPGILTLLGDGEYAVLASRDAEATVLRAPVPTVARPTAPPSAAPPHRRSPLLVALAALALASLLGMLARRARRTR